MKTHARATRLLSMGALALGTALASGRPAGAFDTGHHLDLTQDAMQDQGFGTASIGIAQVANWLTDYEDKAITSSIQEHTSRLHFNSLRTTREVSNYWARFVINTHRAIQEAARDNQPLRALVLLGISLHALQDFYSHSNWVEIHPSDGHCLRTETWFSAPPGNADLHTGTAGTESASPTSPHPSHGGYRDGLNKDSYMKPSWPEAYTFAYVASREWINALRIWTEQARPGFWQRLKATRIRPRELAQDLTATYRLSGWIRHGKHDGHWKGEGSGNRDGFLGTALDWLSRPESPIVQEFRQGKAYLAISDGLSGALTPEAPIPPVPVLPLDHQAVIIRTLAVDGAARQPFTAPSPPGDQPDTFARVTIQDQSFIEATQRDQASFRPYWTTIKFVPKSLESVRVDYRLLTEDTIHDIDPIEAIGQRGDFNHIGLISGRGTALRFTIDIPSATLVGDLRGPLGSPAITVQDPAGSGTLRDGNAGGSSTGDRSGVTLIAQVKPLLPAPACLRRPTTGGPGREAATVSARPAPLAPAAAASWSEWHHPQGPR